MNRRTVGRAVAGLAAAISFAWAGWAAYDNAMPELRVYDGYRMMIGAVIAVALVAPFIWRWRRDRALVAIAVAAALGCLLPLVVSALQRGVPLMARLRGAWILAGADLVGPAMVIGFVCLWLAIREWNPTSVTAKRE
jgi:hypothetical protein